MKLQKSANPSASRFLHPFKMAAAAFILVASCATAAHAFDVNGRIKGTVTDSTGAVVPGATVVATNQLTGVKYTAKAQASGDYLFPALPIGTYTISTTVSGFKGFTASGIVLTIDQEYVEPIKLTAGNAGEVVEVVADSIQVNTTDMQLNNIVDSTQMEELPLVGRGFTSLELIEPGVQASSDRFGTSSVSGSQTQQSSFLINGADINDIALNTPVISPDLDTIDQFNLIEGPLNAEYDRNSGGIVSATLKAGTNHIHGDLFEFYRDTFLDTPNFFAYVIPPPGSTTPGYKNVTPYHNNNFGGYISGPIIKDKLFLMGGYQGTHSRTPAGSGSVTTNVFDSAQRAGNFSEDFGAGNSLGNSFSTNLIPSTINIAGCANASAKNPDTWLSCATNLHGVFPQADWNPIATKLFNQYVPSANSGQYGYNFQASSITTDNQYLGRVDFALNPKNNFTFVGIYDHLVNSQTLPFGGANLPGFGENNVETIQVYTFDYARQLSSTLLNDFALHYTRFNYQAVIPQNYVTPSSLGFNITPELAQYSSVPVIGTGYFTLGFSDNGPQPRIDQNYQIDESITKSLGHHNLKFGYDGRKFYVSNPFSASNSGSYGFSTGGLYSSGDSGLDFLLGNSSSYGQGSGSTIQAYALLNYFYGQDSWKVSNSLVLNVGLGYQIDTPLRSLEYGGLAVACYVPFQQSVIFPSAPQGLNYPGDKGCGNAAHAYTRFGDFGPRIGFAFTPDLGILSDGNNKKLSIRGGFGIYYDRTEEESTLQTLQTPPFGGSTQGAADFGGIPAFANPFSDINGGLTTGPMGGQGQASEANKFPFAFATKGQIIDFTQYEPMYLDTYNANFRSPYAENIQLSVERELPSHIIARLSYVASLAHHNQTVTEGNPISPAGHAACLANKYCSSLTKSIYRDEEAYFFPSNTTYPYVDPNSGINPYAAIGVVGSEGSSNYNSLQASVQKGLSHGLQFQLSYTYAHAMDEASSFENAGFGGVRGYNQFNTSLNYGDAAFDVRHRLVLAPIYTVPKLKAGSAFQPINLALSGWEISGISTFATGFPFDISYGGTSSNSEWCSYYTSYYACPDEPNQLHGITRSNPRVRLVSSTGQLLQSTSWFVNDTGTSSPAFAPAPLGTFGNTHRNEYHGPGINNTDMVLAKNFAISSDGVRRLQLRMTSSNVFNHTQFSNPSSQVSTQQKTINGVPQTVLTTGSFGYIGGAASGRLTQLAVKIYF